MENFIMDAWVAAAALCGASVAAVGLMYGRLTVLTVGSALVLGSILPTLNGVVFEF